MPLRGNEIVLCTNEKLAYRQFMKIEMPLRGNEIVLCTNEKLAFVRL